jgi:hypothetical protein
MARFGLLHLRHRSLVTARSYPSRNRGRMQTIEAAPRSPLDATMVAKALSTKEKDSPLERTRLRLDWAGFAQGLDHRRALLLQRLSEGYHKGEVADELGVSRPRVTQLLADLGGRIDEFFAEQPARPQTS